MSNSYGKVVVLGKSKMKTAPTDIMDVLSSVDPTSVPINLIENVFVTLEDRTRYQIDKKHLGYNLDFHQITNHIKATGAKSPVDVIEVVIDIDYTTKLLEKQMNVIFSPYFS